MEIEFTWIRIIATVDNKPSDFIKDGELLYRMGCCQLLKKYLLHGVNC
jgi:hypothetical protein